MKRLAILLFCTSAYGHTPPCTETECVVPRAELEAMHESLQRYKRERDEAIEAWAVYRSRLNFMQGQMCGVFT